MIAEIHRALVAMREVFPQWDDQTRAPEAEFTRMALHLEPALRGFLFGQHEAFRTAMFSDNVAFSSPPHAPGPIVTLATSAFLWLDMCSRGYLVRGGIAVGPLHHSETQLFGPALIEAHALESKIAVNPRIALSESAVALLKKNEEAGRDLPLYSLLIRRDKDGTYYLDTLGGHVATAAGFVERRLALMRDLRGRIVDTFLHKDSIASPVYSKWVWLAGYFNDVVTRESTLNLEPVDCVP
jgi:hypothetical protein